MYRPSPAAEDDELRHHQHEVRHHERRQDQAKPEVTPWEADARKPIAAERSRKQNCNEVQADDAQRVHEVKAKGLVEQRVWIVLPLNRVGNPLGREDEDLLQRLQGTDYQPDKWRQHYHPAGEQDQDDHCVPQALAAAGAVVVARRLGRGGGSLHLYTHIRLRPRNVHGRRYI